MLKIKKSALVLVLLLAVTTFLMTPISADAANVGYVNMQEIAQSHAAVAEAQQDLEQKATELQQEFQSRTEGLDQEEDGQEIEQIQQEMQQKMQELQMQEQEVLEEQVMPDIEKARKELGYDVVVSEEVVVSGGEEITEQIISYFESADDIETIDNDRVNIDGF